MQMLKFEIEIRNEKIKNYRVITLLIVILNILLFIYFSFDGDQRKKSLLSLSFILLYAAYRFFQAQKHKQGFFFDEWIYFLLMILWVDSYLLAIANLTFFLLYTIALQKIIYIFDNNLIQQKSFPWKKYQWNQLNNVILKDNLLTIDFKNNRIIQGEIKGEDINESVFNTFAKTQLSLMGKQ